MYYTIKEASEKLDISKTTIYQWIKMGKLNAEKDDKGDFIVLKTDVENLFTEYGRDGRYFNCIEAAFILGLKRPQTLSDYCKKGMIKTLTLPNGKRVIPSTEVNKIKKRMQAYPEIKQLSKLL